MSPILRFDPGSILVNGSMVLVIVACLVAGWRRWRIWWVPVLAVGTTWTVGGYLAPVGPVVLGGIVGVSTILDRLRRSSAGVVPTPGP